ncbi:hypothetical protein CPB85DRAFT_356969 [Mucidula mucida]|nr:hypothetical protein CPB85DRAFT_356969 [Mucidula mucida]
MERLSPTLMESDPARHLIRCLSIDASGIARRQTPHHLYDWLRLLPANTLLSLTVYAPTPQDHGKFMGILLQSPALHSIRYLNLSLYSEELYYMDDHSLTELLASAPNISHLSVIFPVPKDSHSLPRYCARWTCVPRVRHILATMWVYTPLFGDLITATQASLETLICDTLNGLVFHSELMRALETTFTSPLRTVFLSYKNLEHERPLLVIPPGAWDHLRELVLSGWRMQWDLISECLPPSLETLVLMFTFFEPFPMKRLVAFVDRTPKYIIFCILAAHYLWCPPILLP